MLVHVTVLLLRIKFTVLPIVKHILCFLSLSGVIQIKFIRTGFQPVFLRKRKLKHCGVCAVLNRLSFTGPGMP